MRNDRWLKVIITSILLIFIIVLPLFSLDDSLKTRVAILPMINKEQSKLLDVICQTMTETIELTLKLMDKYRLTKVEGIDPYKDFMIVRHYLQVNRIDNAIFGKASIDEGVIVFQMSVYDRRKDEITVTKEAIAENIFEIFNASDELVVSLVESFSGMHIGFGEIQLKNTGEEGEFKLYIDGKLAGEDLLSKANVLIGNRSIEIKQKRMFREVVIFHTAAQIIEDEVTKIEFKIPYLLIEEKEVLDRLDGTIKKFWDNRDEAEKVVRSINEALVLLSNVSFCVRLKEARNRYKQIDAEYKIKSNRWELEENLFEPNPKIIEEVVEIYENAERYIHPEKIREKASKNINYFYNLLGLAAVYNFSRSKWEDGLEKYKQMERINNRVSIGSNYLFNDEKEYVYRVYDEYISMERESLRYIKTQLTKYFKVKLKAVKKVFKDYKDVKEKELIVITNPSGMKISLNDKNYGNSPVRIKGLKYREVQVTATDPWLGEVTAKVELEEKRNFLFLESARLKEYSLRVEAKPAKALRSSMFELSWSTVEGAYQYTVQVNAEGGDNKKTLFEFYGLKKNKYRFKKQLEGGKTYSYRVYAENKNGIKSGWSNEAKFEGQLEWKKAANFYPFENSHCHANVIFKNRMWVIGGYGTSAVWYSEDGINWNLATAAAPFGRRANHEAVVFKNRIWVIGGRRPDNINNGQSLNDIWYSEDGVNWKLATRSAPFKPRKMFASTVYDDKIWVIGGRTKPQNPQLNDIWYSEDGVNWKLATRSAPFKPPNGIRAIVYKNKMWIIGKNSDVWYSTNGANWRRTTASAPFGNREMYGAVVYNDKMWLIGGSTDDKEKMLNDVWYSEDGKTWKLSIPASDIFKPRGWFSAQAFKNKLWIIGGHTWEYSLEHEYSDVWYGE